MRISFGRLFKPHEAHQGVSNPVTSAQLQKKIASDFAKKPEGWHPQVCYNFALKVGVLEGKISNHFKQELMSGAKVGGYPLGFSDKMGITASNTQKYFDHTKITGSGIINFIDDQVGAVVHTAYLQKEDGGSVHIYHANCMTLDMALLGDAPDVPKVGCVTHYEVSDHYTQNRLQCWLDGGYSFKFTPASKLSI
ncbi:hypothetical protein PsAD5_03068 [Pseudovibrio sp. Ad5]|uniref:hypothetical protein n=1 Tax=Pseudovibrio sp. Ad5 TaxID=989436 RepID=UPI0007B2245A|nr:hypothetical protein [Pseudovibrio sp. Ad5]KZK93355.1 hypothetical protein PsAD5_03068 [Pseudovibrio sp. Ad5]